MRRLVAAVPMLCVLVMSVWAPRAAAHATSLDSSPQIDWQRTLEDARAVSQRTGRPLLVAVNVDGESSSERIVVERYRDPQFVAWTQQFVCALGSPVRHNPRDYDEQGVRVECPRFGQVTCGEHMALEPAIFSDYLAEPRVSPRHALVQLDGTKSFDLYYLFDMRELDRRLAAAARTAAETAQAGKQDVALEVVNGADAATWRRVATLKHARARTHAVSAWRALTSEADMAQVLRVVMPINAQLGLELCIELGARAVPVSAELLQAAVAELRSAGRLAEWCRWMRWMQPKSVALDECLAGLVVDDPQSRTWCLGVLALGSSARRQAVEVGLQRALGAETVGALLRARAAAGGPVDTSAFHTVARLWTCMDVSTAQVEQVPAPADPAQELGDAEAALAAAPQDPAAMARMGQASLVLARQRIERGEAGVQFLLQDAHAWLERAVQAGAAVRPLASARARTAYLLGDHVAQEVIALQSLASSKVVDTRRAQRMRAWLLDPTAVEAALACEDPLYAEDLRWLGDAGLRLSPVRAQADAVTELEGIMRSTRALAATSCSSSATESDWLAYASAVQMWLGTHEAFAVVHAGVLRLPESNALRGVLHQTAVAMGQPEAAVQVAQQAEALHGTGVCAWYLGSAELLQAEWLRRGLQTNAALQAYGRASAAFERAEATDWLAASARQWRARARMGAAHAHFAWRRESLAADCLVEALALDLAPLEARDGLDRDMPDCIDGIFEWRMGRASAVNGTALADRLDAVITDSAAAARVLSMVADALLREGLRDDGREGEVRVMEQILRGDEEPSARVATEEGRVPTAAGDVLMDQAILVARRALARAPEPAQQRALAQTLSVDAQRHWLRGEQAIAWPMVLEARQLLGYITAGEQDSTLLRSWLLDLRNELGPARPVARDGR